MNLRDNNVKKLAGNTFDVLIIGAGINGAVAATALAARGAKVALVDKGDFAGFTSQIPQTSFGVVSNTWKLMSSHWCVNFVCRVTTFCDLTLLLSRKSAFLPIWKKVSVSPLLCFIAEPCFIGQ